MHNIRNIFFVLLLVSCGSSEQTEKSAAADEYNEIHRPQVHFSPKAHWMNDPNGMVYFDSTYHLFYQHYPDSTVWGPMHWGYATSRDLVRWEHQPIALFPDSLGYIFSGSAVVDVNNTSGFGEDGKVPLVAIFTHHDPKGEKAGDIDFQTQSIAYSLDAGKSWTKYEANPVLKNPGIKDFRDPKVMWHEPSKQWIMTLATKDRVTFYASPNLKDWNKQSEFGSDVGAHGGVWECPDLFALDYQGEEVWVLLVSINPGGPNKGSATQYFTGKFDGKRFVPFQTDTRWVDYGTDNYAGVTFSNTGKRKVFMGWMSNWLYANVVPTEKWRSALTVPRDLNLEKVDGKYFLTSFPVPELASLEEKPVIVDLNDKTSTGNVSEKIGTLSGPAKLSFSLKKTGPFSIILSNSAGQQIEVGFDAENNHYFIDRTKAGKEDFWPGFAGRHTGPRLSKAANMEVTLIVDNASVEFFADNGLSVMTDVFFPDSPLTDVTVSYASETPLKTLQYALLKSIWK